MLPQTRTPWRAGSLAVPRALRGGPFRENPSGFRSPDCRRSVSILGCSAVDATSSRRPAVEHVQGQRKKRRSVTQVAKAAKDFLDGEIQAKQPSDPDPSLYNEDFAPTPADGRTFGWFDLMTLWVGLVVSVPSYCLASSLVDLGLSWSQVRPASETKLSSSIPAACLFYAPSLPSPVCIYAHLFHPSIHACMSP